MLDGGRIYFGGRLIGRGGYVGEATLTDRLGSVGGPRKYYPYGQERQRTPQDTEKFATYSRDATGLDYAWNRQYTPTWGRFMQADPYVSPDALKNPQGWNRYAYAENDPVNSHDPKGLFRRWSGERVPTIMWVLWLVHDDLEEAFTREDNAVLRPPVSGGRTGAGGTTGAGGGGPRLVAKESIPGYQAALDALDSQECAEALGFENGEVAKGTLRMTEIHEDPKMAAPSAVELPPGSGMFLFSYAPARTDGVSIIYVNPSVFWQPDRATVPPTTRTVLDLMREEQRLKTLDAAQAQAIWLLHELGHIRNWFGNDAGDLALSMAYTKRVIEGCFPFLL